MPAARLALVALFAGVALGASVVATRTGAARATPGVAGDDVGIRQTMTAYNAALNGGRTGAVLPLYTTDGVFMAPYSQSSIGIAAVRTAYDHVFDELKFDVRFTIDEIVPISPDWAFVRTNSAGTTHHASTGRVTSEANQELFILRRGVDRKWRIARYSFSPTNPPGPG